VYPYHGALFFFYRQRHQILMASRAQRGRNRGSKESGLVYQQRNQQVKQMITLQEHCQRIAKLGGAKKSEKKAAAARENAKRPRPKARELNALRRAKKSETNS
jgi:hypothetical protein